MNKRNHYSANFKAQVVERIYISEYETPRDLRTMLNKYMKTYNTYRPHSSLGGACPVDYYLKSKLNEAA